MEIQTAIEILTYHQEWRLGKRDDMIHEPKKLTEALDILLTEVKKLHKPNVSGWVAYPETRPDKYGKYFVHRKDGKTHWETWNNTGFAYNDKVITHWMEVKPPCR
jgi:hypothetical protein